MFASICGSKLDGATSTGMGCLMCFDLDGLMQNFGRSGLSPSYGGAPATTPSEGATDTTTRHFSSPQQGCGTLGYKIKVCLSPPRPLSYIDEFCLFSLFPAKLGTPLCPGHVNSYPN
jgi:hypothetical protein